MVQSFQSVVRLLTDKARQWSDNYFAQFCNPWQILYENWRSREMWGGLFWTTEMSKTWEDKACPLSGCRTKSFAQDLMGAFPGKIMRWNLQAIFLGLRKNYETVTLGKGSNCRNILNQWPPLRPAPPLCIFRTQSIPFTGYLRPKTGFWRCLGLPIPLPLVRT